MAVLTPLIKTRKITGPGGSKQIYLPPEVCELFGWQVGDKVRFLVDQETKRLIVEKVNGEKAN